MLGFRFARRWVRRALLLALTWPCIALVAFVAPAVLADPGLGDEPFEITADTIEYEAEREIFVAEGDVRIVQESGDSLEAQWVAFNRQTRRGIASGDAVLVKGDQRLEAEFLEFDLDTLEGLAFDAGFKAGRFQVWAKEMLKTGEDTYWVDDARFTTCECPDPESRLPWQIQASEGDVEIDGYGTAWNATLDVLEVPVFWVPWMMFPVKTERESGVLLPEFGFGGRNGFDVALPVFFAIGDPVNLTVTPRYLTERGFKPEADLEYVFGRKSKGRVTGSFIRDMDVVTDRDWRGDPTKNPDGFSENRWAMRSLNQYYAPGDVRINGEINLVSDNDYPSDFDDFRDFRKNRFLESQLFATRNLGSSAAGYLALAYADDLSNPTDVDRDQFLLQRAPAASVEWMHTPVKQGLGLVTALDVDYVHFWAQRDPEDVLHVSSDAIVGDHKFVDVGFDANMNFQEQSRRNRLAQADGLLDTQQERADRQEAAGEAEKAEETLDPHNDDKQPGNNAPEGDGRFQEGEPLADRGHRMVFYPRLSRPTRMFDTLDFVPELGYQQVLYHSDAQNHAERGVWTARGDLSTTFERGFETEGGGALSHALIPQLGFALAESRDQGGDPFFVPKTARPQDRVRELERENIVADSADRIEDTQLLVWGVGNRFWNDKPNGESRMLADVTLLASYDFEQDDFKRIVLDGRTFHAWNTNTRFNLSVDPKDGEIDEGLFDIDWKGWSGLSLGASYRYLRRIPLFFESFKGDDSERFDDVKANFDRVSQLDGRIRIPLGERLALGYSVNYSIEDNLLLTNRGTFDYISPCKCWAAQFEVRDHRTRGLQYYFRITLLGVGEPRGNPFGGGSDGLGTGSQLP